LNNAAESLIESETIQGEALSALEAAVLEHSDISDNTEAADNRHALAA
jgi:hypothetical protein